MANYDDYIALKKRVAELDFSYHENSVSLVSDFEYDQLFRQLLDIERLNPTWADDDSPTKKVNNRPVAIAENRQPMLSLGNALDLAELNAFCLKIKRQYPTARFVVEHKIDGLAISLIYREGLLFAATTRTGEDILAQVKTVKSIPLNLTGNYPNVIEVRGEVFLPKSEFQRLNAYYTEHGLRLLANPRNAAAGAMRRINSDETAFFNLAAYIYSAPEKLVGSQVELLNYLTSVGLPVNNEWAQFELAADVIEYCQDWVEKRNELSYEIDGMVIKVNDIDMQNELGSTSHEPRWAIAYKFPAEVAEAEVLAIDLSVGRLGQITPVAKLTPTLLGGTIVCNASIHNFEWLNEKDIRVGDTCKVIKAGEIIPQIVEVIKEKRPVDAQKFIEPSNCPICGSKLVKNAGEAAIKCQNDFCPALIQRSIVHFAAKEAMNIEGLSESTVELLLNNKLIGDYADLYYLNFEQLLALPNFGRKSAENLMTAIATSKERGLARLLYALGIRHVGQNISRLLAAHYGSLERIVELSTDELLLLDGIGDVIAKSLIQTLKKPEIENRIAKMRAVGVTMLEYKPSRLTSANTAFSGKTVVATGTLKNFSRDSIKNYLLDIGAIPTESVSKNTDYLLVGEKPGASKLTKAKQMAISIINEDEFLRLVKE